MGSKDKSTASTWKTRGWMKVHPTSTQTSVDLYPQPTTKNKPCFLLQIVALQLEITSRPSPRSAFSPLLFCSLCRTKQTSQLPTPKSKHQPFKAHMHCIWLIWLLLKNQRVPSTKHPNFASKKSWNQTLNPPKKLKYTKSSPNPPRFSMFLHRPWPFFGMLKLLRRLKGQDGEPTGAAPSFGQEQASVWLLFRLKKARAEEGALWNCQH